MAKLDILSIDGTDDTICHSSKHVGYSSNNMCQSNGQ